VVSARPKFSVVIPACNRGELLRACLESVFAQSFRDFEVIVVDDGSTDHTPAVLAEFGDRIRVIRQKNQGQATARNAGIEAARGEYIAFLDCDDLWFPWTMETFNQVLQRQGQPAIIMGSLIKFTDAAEPAAVTRGELDVSAFSDYLVAMCSAQRWSGSGLVVIRRAVLGNTLRFTPMRMNTEDHDFMLKLCVAAGAVWINSPTTLAYRIHTSNSVLNLSSTDAGLLHLIDQEWRGAYPGGAARARERRKIILHLAVHFQMDAMRNGFLARSMRRFAALLPLLWQERQFGEMRQFVVYAVRLQLSRVKKCLQRWTK